MFRKTKKQDKGQIPCEGWRTESHLSFAHEDPQPVIKFCVYCQQDLSRILKSQWSYVKLILLIQKLISQIRIKVILCWMEKTYISLSLDFNSTGIITKFPTQEPEESSGRWNSGQNCCFCSSVLFARQIELRPDNLMFLRIGANKTVEYFPL